VPRDNACCISEPGAWLAALAADGDYLRVVGAAWRAGHGWLATAYALSRCRLLFPRFLSIYSVWRVSVVSSAFTHTISGSRRGACGFFRATPGNDAAKRAGVSRLNMRRGLTDVIRRVSLDNPNVVYHTASSGSAIQRDKLHLPLRLVGSTALTDALILPRFALPAPAWAARLRGAVAGGRPADTGGSTLVLIISFCAGTAAWRALPYEPLPKHGVCRPRSARFCTALPPPAPRSAATASARCWNNCGCARLPCAVMRCSAFAAPSAVAFRASAPTAANTVRQRAHHVDFTLCLHTRTAL